VVNALRSRGEKVGVLKIKLFRPVPVEKIREALRGAKKAAVIDRNCSFGAGGIFKALGGKDHNGSSGLLLVRHRRTLSSDNAEDTRNSFRI